MRLQSNIDFGYRPNISQRSNINYIRLHLKISDINPQIKIQSILLLQTFCQIRIGDCDSHSTTAGGDATVAGIVSEVEIVLKHCPKTRLCAEGISSPPNCVLLPTGSLTPTACAFTYRAKHRWRLLLSPLRRRRCR